MSETSHNTIESYESVAKPVRISENGKEVTIPYTRKDKSCNIVVTQEKDQFIIKMSPQKGNIKPIVCENILSEADLGTKVGRIINEYIQDPTRKKIPEKVSQAFNYIKIMNLINYHNVEVSIYKKKLSFEINTYEYNGNGVNLGGFDATITMKQNGNKISWEFDKIGRIDGDEESPTIDDFRNKILIKINKELGNSKYEQLKYSELVSKIDDICRIWKELLG